LLGVEHVRQLVDKQFMCGLHFLLRATWMRKSLGRELPDE
jgi:hypothetical protein